MELFFKHQRYQWENYVHGSRHDLCVIDEEIFQLVTLFRGQPLPSGRRGDVLNAIVTRELVEKHPEVARLRNRLDDWDNYGEGLAGTESHGSWNYRLALASRMKGDVRALMRKRTQLAKDLGFPSYVHMVLATEDMELEPLLAFLNRYLEENLPKARRLIVAYNLSWPTWFSDIETIGSAEPCSNPNEMIAALLTRLGLAGLQDRIRVISKEQPIAGYVGVLSIPDDIRILVRLHDSVSSWLTLFHELGHAIAYSSNKETGVYRTWTGVHDESMAAVMEHIAAKLVLDRANLQSARDVTTLEAVRCAISALYEISLWRNPDAAESLYTEHYGQLGIDIVSPEIWAIDSFRSVDPVYVHNYVIAEHVATRTVEFLEEKYGAKVREWGEWLASNYYAEGRGRSLLAKTEAIGFSSEWPRPDGRWADTWRCEHGTC
jgi:hypothetical protein